MPWMFVRCSLLVLVLANPLAGQELLPSSLPSLAAEFDEFIAANSPEYTPRQYAVEVVVVELNKHIELEAAPHHLDKLLEQWRQEKLLAQQKRVMLSAFEGVPAELRLEQEVELPLEGTVLQGVELTSLRVTTGDIFQIKVISQKEKLNVYFAYESTLFRPDKHTIPIKDLTTIRSTERVNPGEWGNSGVFVSETDSDKGPVTRATFCFVRATEKP